MFSKEQKKRILGLARKSIELFFQDKKPQYKEGFLREKQGVFVTLKIKDELRGCIGFAEPVYELGKGIIEAARAAAFSDPRFPPVEESELKSIKLEVSVLSVPEEIKVSAPEEYVSRVKVGTDGLIAKKGTVSGLLLPQVAVEWGWDAEEFLKQTCVKAGLTIDAWKDMETTIFKFQAEIMHE
jgi:hypothetical protein